MTEHNRDIIRRLQIDFSLLLLLLFMVFRPITASAAETGFSVPTAVTTIYAVTGHGEVTQEIRITNNTGHTIPGLLNLDPNWTYVTCDNAAIAQAFSNRELEIDRYQSDIANGGTAGIKLNLRKLNTPDSSQLAEGEYSFHLVLSAYDDQGTLWTTPKIPMKIKIYNPAGAAVQIGNRVEKGSGVYDLQSTCNEINFGTQPAGTPASYKGSEGIAPIYIGFKNVSSTVDPITGEVPFTSLMYYAEIEGDDYGAFGWDWDNGPINFLRHELGQNTTYADMYVRASTEYLPAGTYTAQLVLLVSPYKMTWNGKQITDGKIRIPLKMTVTGQNANLPDRVQNLQAEPGNGYVNLNWSPVYDKNDGYTVWRKSGGSDYEEVGWIPGAEQTSFTDSDVTNGTTYTYAVSSFIQNSPKSDPVTAKPEASLNARLRAPVLDYPADASDGEHVSLLWYLTDEHDCGDGSNGNAPIAYFIVYRDGSPLITCSQASYERTSIVVPEEYGWKIEVPCGQAGMLHTYSVAAVDTQGRIGLMSNVREYEVDSASEILRGGSLSYWDPENNNRPGVTFMLRYGGYAFHFNLRILREEVGNQAGQIDITEQLETYNGSMYGIPIDRTVEPGKTYIYNITPITYDGEEMGESKSFTIQIPEDPKQVTYTAVPVLSDFCVKGGRVSFTYQIEYDCNTLNRPFILRIYRNGRIIKTRTFSEGELAEEGITDTCLYTDEPKEDGTYVYYASVTDIETGITTDGPSYSFVKQSSVDTLLKAPDKPMDLKAEAGNNKVRLSWQIPTTGSAPEEYEIWEYVPGANNDYAEGAWLDGKVKVTDLIAKDGRYYYTDQAWNDGQYKYSISARNAAGRSPLSELTNEVTPSSDAHWDTVAPGMPVITAFELREYEDQEGIYYLAAEWKPAADAVEVEGFRMELRREDDDYLITNGDGGGDFRDSATYFGETIQTGVYILKVTASNQIGESEIATRKLYLQFIDMGSDDVTIQPVPSQAYSGQQLKPAITVTYGADQDPLTEGSDYTVSYGPNNEAGSNTGYVEITGVGPLRTGSKRVYFDIIGDISAADFSHVTTQATYTGKAVADADLAVKVLAGNILSPGNAEKELLAGTDYNYQWLDQEKKVMESTWRPSEAGIYYLRFTGLNSYAGTADIAFTVEAKRLAAEGSSSLQISSDLANAEYTSAGTAPVVSVADVSSGSSVPLEQGKDYEVSFRDAAGQLVDVPVDRGMYAIVVSGKGNYQGEVTKADAFEITPYQVQNAMTKAFELKAQSVTYTGTDIIPETTVIVNGSALEQGKDYDLSLQKVEEGVPGEEKTSAHDTGSYVVRAVLKGNYAGTLETASGVSFTVLPAAIGQITVSGLAETYDYTGAPVKPVLQISLGSVMLQEGSDYQVAYLQAKSEDPAAAPEPVEAPIAIGTYRIRITGLNNFEGEIVLTFHIVEKKEPESGQNEENTQKPGQSGNAEESSTGTGGTAPAQVSGGNNQTPVVNTGLPAGLSTVGNAENTFAQMGTDEVNGSAFTVMQAKASGKSKTAVKLSWKAVAGASSYIVYANKVGKTNKLQKAGTTSGRSLTISKLNGKKLKKGTYYKFLVLAVDGQGNVRATSRTLYAVTKGSSKTNPKKLQMSELKTGGKKLKGKKASAALRKLKVGKKATLKIKVVKESSGKVKQYRKLQYETSDARVATINQKGVIQAVGKGSCSIYVFAQNGVSLCLKITVK